MIDVLHVISGLGTGGAETMLVQLAGGLRSRGLSQHVVSLNAQTELAGALRTAGVDLTVAGAKSLASFPAAMRSLLRSTSQLRPRLIQGWMYHGNLAASLSHNLCRGKRSRRLFWNLRASNMDARRYARIIRCSALLSRQVDVVISNSQAGIDFHRAHGFRPRRFELIANGVDTEKFCPDAAARREVRAELGIAEDAVVVLHVARVDAMKDHQNFLAAMAQLPSVIGVMVGEGTRNLPNLPNVRALGLRRDTARLYASGDIVASSSAFGEGFSNVIAEGMSAGLVPVVTDVGDARRIVGGCGPVVLPRDPNAFAKAIDAVAKLPAAERGRRGLAARAHIAANFTLAQSVEQYKALYSAAN
jgi:glycosyltransferase involved in cell wall biosynthesis